MSAHIAIVGDGAIGSLLAAGAQQNQHAYSVLLRAVRPAVAEVEHLDGTSTQLGGQPQVTLSAQDLLILPVKYYQVAPALEQWKHLIDEKTPVVLLQNGMGGDEVLASILPNNPLYLATTSHGALKVSPRQVKHTGKGETKLGVIAPIKDTAGEQTRLNKRVIELVSTCLPPVLWQEDIRAALWEKLAINLVINPLTALHNIPNGALSNPRYGQAILAICHETAAVMTACGYAADSQTLVATVNKVIQNTANNYSSMHQDLHHGRQTEIDGITGYLIKQAKKNGIDVPINTALYQKILRLSAGN
ncbi:2-dehydropantoate 2-reductase [Alteromonas sp. 14N.309.X.WAT.G.H12]|uniref:ketopantoate reductase family protein n=1 Tax=Alteromonas sp. 14N.309.X.WAT.G.H12 TaxID=3120824 RepID=UPI002FD38563